MATLPIEKDTLDAYHKVCPDCLTQFNNVSRQSVEKAELTAFHVLRDGEGLAGVEGHGPVDGVRRPHVHLLGGLDPGGLGGRLHHGGVVEEVVLGDGGAAVRGDIVVWNYYRMPLIIIASGFVIYLSWLRVVEFWILICGIFCLVFWFIVCNDFCMGISFQQ